MIVSTAWAAADMKGFFAVILEAIRELPLQQLKQPLVIIATADEESTMCGAKSLTDLQRRLGRHAMIGEPTNMQPVRMHKGISMESIRLHGHAGHSSDPSLGVNALDGMHQVLGEVIQWRGEAATTLSKPGLQGRFPHPSILAISTGATILIGYVASVNCSSTCGSCRGCQWSICAAS